MPETKSVVIKLTNEQREAIRKATGKDISELKVEGVEGRITPAMDFATEYRKAPGVGERFGAEERKAPGVGGDPDIASRKAPGVGGPEVE